MSGSLNKVTLIGNLGQDPEIRSLGNGGKVASLRLATSETWKDKQSGERREKTEWHSISIFNENLVGIVDKYLKKGSKIYIEGALQTRKWQDKDGNDRYSTEVVLQNFNGEIKMLDSRPSDGSAGARVPSSSGTTGSAQAKENFDLDDDVPFNSPVST